MRSFFPLVLALGAAALLTGVPLAAQPALTGPEIFVDPPSQPETIQRAPSAATDANGRLMVVWVETQEERSQLRGRVLDASGRPDAPAFTLDTGGQNPAAPTLAPAAPEGFLLTWQAREQVGKIEKRTLFARRLSPSGQPLGDVIQIRGPVTVGLGPWTVSMQTASASDGSFVVVWSESNPQTLRDNVFIRRFAAAGRPLAKAAPLPREGGNDERRAPSVTVLDDGEIRVAWKSRALNSLTEVFWVRRFDRNGVPLAAPVRPLPENADYPAVTFGPDGGFLTTWATREDDFLHLRAFAPDGTPFSEHQAAIPWWYQATSVRDGTFLVFATDTDALVGLQIEADGTPHGPVGNLTNPAPGYPTSLAVAGTDGGGLVLFWSQDGRTGISQDYTPRLYSQRLATAGPGTFQIERARSALLETGSEPLQLRILRRDGTAGTVSVDYRLTGAAAGSGTLTFPDGDSRPRIVSIQASDDSIPGNDRSVQIALSRPTGGAVLGLPRRAVVEIRDDDEPSPLLARAEPPIELANVDRNSSSLLGPSLAASHDGGFAAAWGHTKGTDTYFPTFHLEGVRFDAAAFPLAGFETACDAEAGRVRLAMHPEGDFMVLWQPGPNYGYQKPYGGLAQRFDARGTASGPVVSLGYPLEDGAPLPKGQFVAVGRGRSTAEKGLFAHFLSTQGFDRRSRVLVTLEALQPGSPAAVATDGIGRSVVVWSVAPTGPAPAGLFARRFNSLGVPLGPVFRVSQWEGYDLLPSVAMNGPGTFVVAWQRNGTGVYARAFNAAGAPLSDEILVNSETGEAQAAPSVALTGDGRFAVFWQSGPVRGQLFAGDGKRLGSEAEIAAGWGYPTAVWSDRGYFVTIVLDLGRTLNVRRLPL